jgi:hypothetical protein
MFPEGFELPKGKEVVFTAKSSNPDTPVIKVPILQTMHFPAGPQVPPTPPPAAATAPRAQATH